MKKTLIILSILAFFSACKENTEKSKSITNASDYNKYLTSENKSSYETALSEKDFWSKRLDADTTGVGDMGPLAGAYGKLFATTGDGQYLSNAETMYKKAMDISANNKDGYARGLARTYISQHRFKEAQELLEESYAGVSNKKETEFMLFDIYMETGNYEKANENLEKIKNNGDFNYLIRQAKWNDYNGELDAAIRNLEKAKEIAESRKSKPLKIWTYSNLGDFYGHAGRIEDAYQHYLMTLELEPDNAYAKKGIAWINYSYQKNTKEANRILDSILKNHKVPDYHLLKAEMAEFNNDTSEANNQKKAFIKTISEGNYGNMYNGYLIELYADTDPQKALKLAQMEIENRATPETYDLLAYAQLKAGQKEQALKTIKDHVVGKTFEPTAQYHTALIYKANGMNDAVTPLKEELEEAAFEIGPVVLKDVKNL
ncbi:tetratricopeptide repeat protein [Cochleicola gelatinilyticus]|uniref:Cell surface protein n=1 Tax=Cochleicola gelatinilyticus TaxID=1763537 RepID=A0A167HR29_9FLAO|nr:hypothetical protein [Cochleicola gelatinilyticus]OAB78875.1 hypothetical protein ULVI_09855 [Cochleicola gelatinilyticus]